MSHTGLHTELMNQKSAGEHRSPYAVKQKLTASRYFAGLSCHTQSCCSELKIDCLTTLMRRVHSLAYTYTFCRPTVVGLSQYDAGSIYGRCHVQESSENDRTVTAFFGKVMGHLSSSLPAIWDILHVQSVYVRCPMRMYNPAVYSILFY